MTFRILFIIPLLLVTGCTGGTDKPSTAKAQKPTASKAAPMAEDDVCVERAKLSPNDRLMVETQEWGPVTDERLGSMGAPVKLMIKDKLVFICCGGYTKKAETDPDKTLAKIEELKERKKTNPPK